MVSTNLAFRILATDDGATRIMSSVGGGADHLHGRLALLSKGSERFGEVIRDAFKLAAGAVLGAGLIEGLKSIWEEAEKSELITRQTEAVIKSTGGSAHVTAGQVGELAQRISAKTAVDDEAIQTGANLLLTFRGIRNEAGKGNDVFNQATMAVTDMTAAMNGGVVSQEGLKAQSILVGKALQDPIGGLGRLARAGVMFTDQQKAQIKVMVQSGDTLGAQKIILRELSKEFGGSAEAAATGAKRLGVVINNVKEDIGKGLVRVVDEAGNAIADHLPAALATGQKALTLIEGPIVRIGADLKTIFIPLMHDGAEAVKPLAVLVGGSLVVGLRLLADALDFIARHEGVFVPLAEGALAFLVASKGVTLITAGYKALVGLLETAALKALYAKDGMKALAAGEDAAKVGALGLNLALGAAGLIVGALAAKHMRAKQAQEEHNSAVQAFSQVLRDNNGAINANVTAQRAAELEQKGLIDLAGRAGINLATYTQATLGNAAAQHAVTDALHAAKDAGVLTREQFVKLAQGTYDYMSVTTDAATANVRLATATETTTGATKNHTAAAQAAAAQLAAEKQKSDELWMSLTRLANINLSAMSAHLALQAAILDVDRSLKGLDGTTKRDTLALTANTVAGNAARQTLIQHLQAALADGEAQKARGVGTARATKSVQDDIAALRQHYINLGYNRTAVDAVIASLGNLGKQHPKATATVDTSQANRAVDALNRKLTTLDGRTVSTYTYNFQQDIVRAAGGGRTGHAEGGLFRGWSWLGERGPELGYTPDTTAVFTAEQSRQMIASFQGLAGGRNAGSAVHIEHLDVHLDAVTGRAAALEFVQEVKKLTRSGWSVSV